MCSENSCSADQLGKHLHIISFDVPHPPSYGGVIDVYFKIRALQQQGVKVHLHCFDYGRTRARELELICASVHYYKRKNSKLLLFGKLPYIVSTRSSEELVQNLLGDEYPILFEGLHCCYHLDDPRLKDRKKIVRMHNIEHDYYTGLAKVEKNFFKRWYFNKEAEKLKAFEKILSGATNIIAISPADAYQLEKKYANVNHIMAFHPDEKVNVEEGRGTYALYHGNLAIGENNEAALYLIRKIFNDLDIPLVIAGNNPSSTLVAEAKRYDNVTIKSNIPTEQIYGLVRYAQINILPTFQATGIKLKLLSALFNGRFCVVNSPMVANTGLSGLCVVADSADTMKQAVKELYLTHFDKHELRKREERLAKEFSNAANAKKLISYL